MDFGKRVASAYQFVLDDLKAPNKRLISALTLLALEDIAYCKNIVEVINQQVLKVDRDSKLFVIFLIDSIVKTVDGGVYREMFGKMIPSIVLHVFETASNGVKNDLCKVRQTWNALFGAGVLDKLDAKVRRIDADWPLTQSQRKCMAEVREVDSQIELMRKEIELLEQQLDASQRRETKEMCESKKRFREEVEVGEISSKKLNVSQSKRKSSFDCDSEMNLMSSVLLTPSPEREEPELDSGAFWLTMSNLERSNPNSPTILDSNACLPFLNESCVENNAIEMSLPEVSVDMQNSAVNFKQTAEEVAVEKELEVIEPNVPFINLDNYNESLCMVPNAIIKTEPKLMEFDENECEEPKNGFEEQTNDNLKQPISSPEPYRTSPQLMITIDGNIELEPLKPSQKTSKQIKINLTNSKVGAAVVEPRIESPKTPDIQSEREQTKRKNPSEWETPVISYEVKESMKNATFHEQPICRKGWEQSGICSLM